MPVAPYAWFPAAAADVQVLLADIGALCAYSLDAARVRVRMRPLPFYELFNLYELTEEGTPDQAPSSRRAYMLWSPGLVEPLTWENKPIYELNDALAKLHALHLTEVTAPDYLRFFWGLVKSENGFFQLLENTEMLVRAEEDDAAPPPADPNASATPPESWHLAPQLQVQPLAAGGFQADLFISFQHNLFTAQSRVTSGGMVDLSDGQLLGKILTPVPPPDEQQPHESLPLALTAEARQQQPAILVRQRYAYQASLLERVRAGRPAETTGFEWHDIDPATHIALIAAINSLCAQSLHPELVLSRRTPLPFYELVDLYEVETFGTDAGLGPLPRLRTYVLWAKPNYQLEGVTLLQPLNWTNSPIYALAEEMTRFGLLKLDATTSPAYLRFFFNLVKGRHGFFRILEVGTVEVNPETGPSYLKAIDPLVAQATPTAAHAQPTEFQTALPIEFKNSIFQSTGYVTTNGQVRLADEVLLGDLLTAVVPLSEHLAASLPQLWEFQLREAQSPKRQQAVFQLGLQRLRQVAEQAPKEQGWETLPLDEFLAQLKEASSRGETLRRKRVLNKRVLGNLTITADGLQGLGLTDRDAPADNDSIAGNSQEVTGTGSSIVITDADCPQGKIRLEDCYFDGLLRLEVRHPHALFAASRCFFRDEVVFDESWVGNVIIKSSHFLAANSPPPTTPQLRLLSVNRAGSVELEAVWLMGGLALERLHCTLIAIRNSRLEGDLALAQLRCDSIIIDKGSTLTGLLDLRQLHCETVKLSSDLGSVAEIDMSNAVVQRLVLAVPELKMLNLTDTVVQGMVEITSLASGHVEAANLRCAELILKGRPEKGTLQALYLQAIWAARVHISAVRCQGACLLDGATIEFNLSVFDTTIDGKLSLINSTLRSLALSAVRIGENCDLTGTIVARKMKLCAWYGHDGDSGVHIGGHLLLDRVQAGHLDMSLCTIGQDFSARDAQFASFNFWPGLLLAPGKQLALSFRRSQVLGCVRLAGTIVTGDFNWVGIDVGQNAGEMVFDAEMLQVQGHFQLTSEVRELRKNILDIYTGHTGIDDQNLDKKVHKAAENMPDAEWQNWSVFQGFVSLKGLVLSGNLNCCRSQIAGDLTLDFGKLGGSLLLTETHMRGVSLKGLVLAGDLDCLRSQIEGNLILDFSQLGGSLLLNGTPIAGSLHLTRCHVQHHLEIGQQTQVAGDGIFTALHVGGSLRFTGAGFAHSLHLNDARLAQGLTTMGGLVVGGRLLLNATRAQENIDLTGLVLGQQPCEKCQPLPTDQYYQLSATDLVVEASLLLSPELPAVEAGRHACVPGDIDLSRARLQRLVLFDEERFALRKQAALAAPFATITERLKLEDAEIGTLRVHQPPPRRLLLRGLSVREWDFEPLTPQAKAAFKASKSELGLRLQKLEDDRVSQEAQSYIIFLERSEKIPASLYRAVEQRLYDEGDTKASDEIYKSLRDREIREISSPFRRVGARAANSFFGYFVTLPSQWTWITIGVLFFASTLIFSNPAWIIPSSTTTLVGKAAMPLAAQGSYPTIWAPGNGIWLALRYHLPLIQAVSHPTWVPSDQPWHFMWSHYYWLSPEGYATLVSLISWIIAPIFILIASRSILRRVKQGG